jgi:proline dehydrogenase
MPEHTSSQATRQSAQEPAAASASANTEASAPQPSADQISFQNTELAFRYRSSAELRKAQFLYGSLRLSPLVKYGPSAITLAMNMGLPVKGLVHEFFFTQFCGGRNLEEAMTTVERLYRHGVLAVLDYAVEAEKSESGFERVRTEVDRIIDTAKARKEVAFVAMKLSGIGSTEVMAKLQAGSTLAPHEERQYERMRERLDGICKHANEQDQPIYVDAEESWIQSTIDELVEEMMIKYNKHRPLVYTTVQMYRKDRLAYLKEMFRRVRFRQAYPGVKLVRGAYLEKEAERARKRGYENPLHSTKAHTDRDYNAAQRYIMERIDKLGLCAGQHNEVSAKLFAKTADELGLPRDHPNLWASQLYGMSDHISFPLAEAGFNVAKYLPYGPLKSVMPYLFRRAQENSSIKGQTSRELRLIEEELKRRNKARTHRTLGTSSS